MPLFSFPTKQKDTFNVFIQNVSRQDVNVMHKEEEEFWTRGSGRRYPSGKTPYLWPTGSLKDLLRKDGLELTGSTPRTHGDPLWDKQQLTNTGTAKTSVESSRLCFVKPLNPFTVWGRHQTASSHTSWAMTSDLETEHSSVVLVVWVAAS